MEKVSNDFRTKAYSGESLYACILSINGNVVPTEQIKKIEIKSPIIDSTNDVYYIGTFISQQLTISFKNLNNLDIVSGNKVILQIGQLINGSYEYVKIGEYLIDDLSENYQQKCEIPCLDYSVIFKKNIDYSPCFTNGSAKIDTILKYICNYFNITLGSYPTTNGDIEVSNYDSSVSGKEWISYIAEIKGCNAKMGRDGSLNLIPLNNTQASTITIDALSGKSWELGEKYKISKVVFFDALRNYTYGDDTNNTLYIRQTNPYIKDTVTIENIYNLLKDYEVYTLKEENFGDISLDCWDNIKYSVGKDSNGNLITYNTLNDNTIVYEMSVMTTVNPKIPTKQQEVTTNVVGGNTETKYKKLKSDVDLVKNEITLLSGEIVQLDNTITGYGVLSLTNCSKTDLYSLNITGNDSLIYPSSKLFPSSTLYLKNSKLYVNRGTDDEKIYDLKIPSLRVYNTVYDEYNLVNGKATLTKRVGLNSDLTYYELPTPIITDLGEVNISLIEGTNTLEMPSFPTTFKLSARYLLKNKYTDSFATQAEVNSEINIATENIYIGVDKKINDYDVVNAINLSTEGIDLKGNRLTVEADNLTIASNGDITLKDGATVLGEYGMLTNLYFVGTTYNSKWIATGSYGLLGYSTAYNYTTSSEYVYKDAMVFDFKIPSDFYIVKATVNLFHSPSLIIKSDGDSGTQGYSRNLNLYKGTTSSNPQYIFNYVTGDLTSGGYNYSKIPNAFGTDGFTGSLGQKTSIESIDIKKYLLNDSNRLMIQSDASTPSVSDVDQYNGACFAYINIIGYTKYKRS